jgi:hypothetical protein
MDKQHFLVFLENNVLSLFTGSEVVGEEVSSPRDACVAQGGGGALLVKFHKSDDYRFVVKRAQPFKPFEISIIKTIIDEFGRIHGSKLVDEFHKDIERIITERAICKSLTTNHLTLQHLISSITAWSQRTYEGHRTAFGFILTNRKAKETNKNLFSDNFLAHDYSALLSDGINTFLEVSADGYITGYITAPKKVDENLLVPYEYLKMANLCTGNKIGVCLLIEGDILIFKNRSLMFAKRSGNWVCFNHDVIIDRLAERAGESEDVRKAVYLSAIDTSFNRCGGCIVHVNMGERPNVLKHINVADVLCEDCYNFITSESKTRSFFADLAGDSEVQNTPFSEFLKEDKCSKIANLIKLINNRKFQELDRKLRLELMAIDGATVVDYDGRILAVGAIIKIEAGSSGGGRLAAAKMLSNYGIAIKISNDGSIQGFRTDRNKLRVKPIFVLG